MMCPSQVPLVRSWLVLSNIFFLGLVFQDIKVFGLFFMVRILLLSCCMYQDEECFGVGIGWQSPYQPYPWAVTPGQKIYQICSL